ncbi:MAG: cobaltochelatase subunit CobN, partial [Proteobacteria bacterium]|nr:cobaltochelatase subunit CobN [Pseudomonadota bacterium]
MHLLAAQPGAIVDGTSAVDLGQSPGDIVVLTAADSEIALLSQARREIVAEHPAFPTLRLANLLQLSHNLSVDLYVERVIAPARLVVVRLLGGRSYWPYGVDQIVTACRARGIPLALLPGDARPDSELAAFSTVAAATAQRWWQYLLHGGPGNATQFLNSAAAATGYAMPTREPMPFAQAGLYWPGIAEPALSDVKRRWRDGAPLATIVFYRALVQAADTAVIDALIAGLQEAGLNPLPLYVATLKDQAVAALVRATLAAAPPDVILNLTGFAVGDGDPLATADCPVLQVVLAGGDEAGWRAGTRGLASRDVAMSVALPELDGRVLSRAVAFKDVIARDTASEVDVIGYRPRADRVAFVAALAAAWARLRRTQPAERRIAIVLANYPNRDGRIGNGVGLDTPASVITVLRALAASGYRVADIP